MNLENCYVGNVIQINDNDPEIIIDVQHQYIVTIPIDMSNVTITHNKKTQKRREQCWNDTDAEFGKYESDCPYCHGTGYYMKTIYGMDKAIILASNIKEFMVNKIIKF